MIWTGRFPWLRRREPRCCWMLLLLQLQRSLLRGERRRGNSHDSDWNSICGRDTGRRLGFFFSFFLCFFSGPNLYSNRCSRRLLAATRCCGCRQRRRLVALRIVASEPASAANPPLSDRRAGQSESRSLIPPVNRSVVFTRGLSLITYLQVRRAILAPVPLNHS